MNHLSKQISAIGREMVLKRMQHETHKTPMLHQTTTNADGQTVLLNIYTKRHMLLEGAEVTGMNEDAMFKLEQQLATLKLEDAFLVFVDSKYGQVYGAYHTDLKKGASFWGLNFPYIKASHGGRLVLFPVHKMPTLFHIPQNDLDLLRKLQADNKHDKNQQKLF